MFNVVRCSPIDGNNPLYIIDSNVYLELAKFYYNGTFTSSHDNNEMIDWFLNARKNGTFLYDFATFETSFDYGSNQLNNKSMGQTVFAVDALITELNDAEIRAGIAHNKIYDDIVRDFSSIPKSIFDCTLPSLLFNEYNDLVLLYYFSYLYRLKIQSLYQDKKIDGFKKLEELFYYMLNEVGLIAGIEFQLGKMLFVGDSKATELSKKFLKSDSKPDLRLINNSIIDIMIFRIAKKMASIPEMLNTQVLFVTCDIALFNLFNTTETIVTGKGIAELHTNETAIAKKYQHRVHEFYEHSFLPNVESRFKKPWEVASNRNSIIEKIKSEIVAYENIIY